MHEKVSQYDKKWAKMFSTHADCEGKKTNWSLKLFWNISCKIEVKGLLCVARLKGGNNEEDCLLKYNTFFE